VAPVQSCIANLRQIEGAKAVWALEHNKTNLNDMPTDSDLFGTGSYIPEKPKCSKGGHYSLGNLSEKPRCTIPKHSLELGDVYVRDQENRALEGAAVSTTGPSGYATIELTGTNGLANISLANLQYASGIAIKKAGYVGCALPLKNDWPLRVVLRRSNANAESKAK